MIVMILLSTSTYMFPGIINLTILIWITEQKNKVEMDTLNLLVSIISFFLVLFISVSMSLSWLYMHMNE